MVSKKVIFGSVIVLVALAIAGSVWYRFIYVPGSKPWLPVSVLKIPTSLHHFVPNEIGASVEMENTNIVQRVSSDIGQLTKLGGFTHHYSRRQAWNTEETLVLSVEGHIYSSTGEFITSNDTITSEAVWSNVDPEIVYAIQQLEESSNRLVTWNVVSGQVVELFHFEKMTELTIGQWEGTVSNDDKLVVLYGKEDGVPTIVSIDLLSKEILGKIEAKEISIGQGFLKKVDGY